MYEIELNREDFSLFQSFIYDKIGIALTEQKLPLIKGRLQKRLMQLKMGSFKEYYERLIHDFSGEELAYLSSAVSTNVTSFFREEGQWEWFRTYLPKLIETKTDKRLRIWSAGCSSGEEPYSIIMFLYHHLSDFEEWDIKVLATDISKRALRRATRGEYSEQQVRGLPQPIFFESFQSVANHEGEIRYRIIEGLRDRITFRLYNLVTDPFFFKNRFDMIFCRNVMIYFDAPTRAQVIERFTRILEVNSPLLLGSSESLSAFQNHYKLIGSSIYMKTH